MSIQAHGGKQHSVARCVSMGTRGTEHGMAGLMLEGVCRGSITKLGYVPLPGMDDTEDPSATSKKRQEHFEAETERILMDTYNSLYKCQEFIPLVSPSAQYHCPQIAPLGLRP